MSFSMDDPRADGQNRKELSVDNIVKWNSFNRAHLWGSLQTTNSFGGFYFWSHWDQAKSRNLQKCEFENLIYCSLILTFYITNLLLKVKTTQKPF
jgi:hypothetical protein